MTFDDCLEKNEEVANLILEAAWITRWNKNQTSLRAVLEPEEAMSIVAEIFTELEKRGYEIVKK